MEISDGSAGNKRFGKRGEVYGVLLGVHWIYPPPRMPVTNEGLAQDSLQKNIILVILPLDPVTVTTGSTRIITFLVGNPHSHRPSSATVTGCGVDLRFTVVKKRVGKFEFLVVGFIRTKMSRTFGEQKLWKKKHMRGFCFFFAVFMFLYTNPFVKLGIIFIQISG